MNQLRHWASHTYVRSLQTMLSEISLSWHTWHQVCYTKLPIFFDHLTHPHCNSWKSIFLLHTVLGCLNWTVDGMCIYIKVIKNFIYIFFKCMITTLSFKDFLLLAVYHGFADRKGYRKQKESWSKTEFIIIVVQLTLLCNIWQKSSFWSPTEQLWNSGCRF